MSIGVRTQENTYTSPVLEVCTWRELRKETTTTQFALSQRVALGGMQTERDKADHRGLARGATQRQLEIEEETVFIPVDSILSIKHSSEIRKGHTEYQHIIQKKPQQVKLSCCDKVKQWCNRSFCCCCNNSDKRLHTELPEIRTTIQGEHAERRILVTIEYIRYSNIHTPSHVRALAISDQGAFYRENLHKDTMQFYLMDNSDCKQTDFELKHMQASVLCRLVTDFKAMVGHYPDEPTFQTILKRHDGLAIGEPPKEDIVQLMGLANVTTQLQLAIPLQQ